MIRDHRNIYWSALLGRLPWLEHGFGTRHLEDWTGGYTSLKQIHSSVVVDASGKHGVLGRGDALVTAEHGNWIGIRTADCVPVLLADREKKVVAAVHAGWRGTVSNIVGNTLAMMRELYGSDPAAILAAIGPCIANCCYEVGPEVAEQFESLLPERRGEKAVDLVLANRRQLQAAGVPSESIDEANICTKCLPEEFFSFRREAGEAGRMVSAIRIVK